MRHRPFACLLVVLLYLCPVDAAPAQDTNAAAKPMPKMSSFYSFFDATADFPPGMGIVQRTTCTTSTATQDGIYSGNYLLDCDGEVAHEETTIVVNPLDPAHVVGGYHSHHVNFLGATVLENLMGTVSVSFDGGSSWREVTPPITPYQYTSDPALAFDSNGRLYFSNIADRQSPNFRSSTGPSVVVATSDDGGLTWTNPVTVAEGQGGIDPRNNGVEIFQDKDYIAADQSPWSPFRNRVYVTWASFQSKLSSGISPAFFRVPIQLSFSDDGSLWSTPKDVSGFSTDCTVQVFGNPANECNLNQDSYPAIAPGGKVYVSFENFNTPAENQIMVVSSPDGGNTWSAPVKVDDLFDINFPGNVDGRATLTGCQLRYGAKANTATDPGDTSGKTVYVAWADNRNDTRTATNVDVFLGRSTDGGVTWRVYTVDSSANDQFFPWVAVAPNGRVDVGYMDRSYSAGQNVCQYGFTLTRLTFDSSGNERSTTRTRVDSGLSDPGHSRWFSGTTVGNSRFIGDYNGIAIGSDGATQSLWTDQRILVANPPDANRTHGQHVVGVQTP